MRRFELTHWLALFCWLFLATSSAFFHTGCATTQGGLVASLPGGASWHSLPIALWVETREGTLQAKTAENPRWHLVSSDGPLTAVTHLRVVAGRGAIFSLGDPGRSSGRLWVQSGTTLRVGAATDGAWHLAVSEGRVRWSLFDERQSAFVWSKNGWDTVTGGDVLVSVSAGSQSPSVLSTHDNVPAADWSLALQSEAPNVGMGTLEVRSASNTSYLQLNALSVDAVTRGDRVAMRVEHVFRNPTDDRMEGTFRFPLPDGAIVTGLAMDVNGELMRGEIVEREKARKIYQGIVDSMRDPAILEWEDGNTFKLRVFPIEPRSDKRVVLEYLTVPERAAEGSMLVYTAALPAFQAQLPHFVLRVDGVERARHTDVSSGQQWRVPLVRRSAPAFATRHLQEDGSVLTAIRVTPHGGLRRIQKTSKPTPETAKRRRVLVWVDTSRSALESYDLSIRSVERLLRALRPNQPFLVVASDLAPQQHAVSFQPASPQHIDDALRFLRGITPDGASDLGRAMQTVRAMAENGAVQTDVVYVGDGAPTWGNLENPWSITGALHETTIRLSAILMGRNAVRKQVALVAEQTGGVVSRPRTLLGVDRFLLRWQNPRAARRLDRCVLAVPDGHALQVRPAVTRFPGESLEALVYTPNDAKPLRTVTMKCFSQGKPIQRRMRLAIQATDEPVAQRWAAGEIARLQSTKENKAQVVALSEKHGVLSKYTAFLVLESEEAYKQHNIERRRGPKVTGADLESVGRQASLSPNHIQPGDPEIQVPAPADARSVVVVFPFGVTKIANYEESLRAWTVRFLIDKSTPDGVYFARVRITHSDGRIEVLRLPYNVDTQAPTVVVNVRKSRRSRTAYIVTAKQVAKDVELARVLPAWKESNEKDRLRKRYARLVMDAARVEIRMPDGQRIRLKRTGDGQFRAVWRPRHAVDFSVPMTVVAVDVPGNRTVFEQHLPFEEEARHE